MDGVGAGDSVALAALHRAGHIGQQAFQARGGGVGRPLAPQAGYSGRERSAALRRVQVDDLQRSRTRFGRRGEAEEQGRLDLAPEAQPLVGVGEQADISPDLSETPCVGLRHRVQAALQRETLRTRPIRPGVEAGGGPADGRADLNIDARLLDRARREIQPHSPLAEAPRKPHPSDSAVAQGR